MIAGRKYDQDKAPIVQGCLHYFAEALIAVAMISRYGAEKYNVSYADRNFERVDDATNRYTDAVGRHLLGDAIDGPYDAESGYLHAAHDAWNALARLKMMLTRDHMPLRDPNFVSKPKADVVPLSVSAAKDTQSKLDHQFQERLSSMSDDWQHKDVSYG